MQELINTCKAKDYKYQWVKNKALEIPNLKQEDFTLLQDYAGHKKGSDIFMYQEYCKFRRLYEMYVKKEITSESLIKLDSNIAMKIFTFTASAEYAKLK